MTKFRVGDRVRVVRLPYAPDVQGVLGTVTSLTAPDPYELMVRTESGGDPDGELTPFLLSELELDGIPADPHCPDCGGSGIAPDSKPTYHPGAPGIADPAGWEPCDCVVRRYEAVAASVECVPSPEEGSPDD